MENKKVYSMKLSKIYPLLVAKEKKKNRSKEEVNKIIFNLKLRLQHEDYYIG